MSFEATSLLLTVFIGGEKQPLCHQIQVVYLGLIQKSKSSLLGIFTLCGAERQPSGFWLLSKSVGKCPSSGPGKMLLKPQVEYNRGIVLQLQPLSTLAPWSPPFLMLAS